MSVIYRTSEEQLDRIRDEEALRFHAYPDPESALARGTRGVRWGFGRASELRALLPVTVQLLDGKPWTIGYGTTVYPNGKKVMPDDECTIDQADLYLRNFVGNLEADVNEAITNDVLTQPMFDALISMAYNVGAGAFVRSSLVRHINAGAWINAQREFDLWVNAGGMKSGGLVKRRNREQQQFNDGIRYVLKDAPEVLALFNEFVELTNIG